MSNKITRRGFLSVAAVAASPFLEALPATAARSDGIEVQVDVGGQRMEVYVEGRLRHRWTVSTGKNGHDTPGGTYRPQRLEREWYSTKYDDALPRVSLAALPHTVASASPPATLLSCSASCRITAQAAPGLSSTIEWFSAGAPARCQRGSR
jgi:L,D-transpeptidase catalytic domain